MIYLLIKAALSGVIVATVSEVAKRYPGFGGLIASLPLVSVLGMMWLWHDTHDPVRMSAHVSGTLWFIAPSVPMFVLIPMLLKRGIGFWPALASGCLLTIVLYAAMIWAAPKVGIRL
jgi:Mg/Co/Ni transporter MgtE